jgi:hypothetical protein
MRTARAPAADSTSGTAWDGATLNRGASAGNVTPRGSVPSRAGLLKPYLPHIRHNLRQARPNLDGASPRLKAAPSLPLAVGRG